jgi:hypothetical protein
MKNENIAIEKSQLELTLPAPAGSPSGFQRPRRFSRARWWFEQMHRVVDEAASWQPPSPVNIEETDLTVSGTHLLTPRR